MTKNKILISGLGGSLFPYLNEKLVEKGFEILYVDSNEELKFIYPDLKFYTSPIVTNDKYINFILDIIEKNDINYYIPLIDEELLIAKLIGYIKKDLKVLLPSKSFIKLCLNKFKLMKKLNELDISKTKSFLDSNFNWEIDPPIFVKPNFGRGSRGIKKVYNKLQFEAYRQENKDEILIQPIIEGIEYTVGVLVNNENEILSISPKRIIKKDRVTINAVTENNSIIYGLAKKLTKILKPRGPYNIQLFITSEMQPIIFEINPRFSTTLILSIEAGVNEVELLINNFSNQAPNFNEALEGVYLYRNWKNNFYKK
ncbi:ATP-grasp domain-containing protein [Flavobacteriaceae bacterium]|nr:ATP-grasp domain-containing protein [Flavobacteriaceae bacterium]